MFNCRICTAIYHTNFRKQKFVLSIWNDEANGLIAYIDDALKDWLLPICIIGQEECKCGLKSNGHATEIASLISHLF